MSISDEKPWILDTGSFKLDLIQLDQEERDNLIKDLEEGKDGATLRDGSYIGHLKGVRIIANPHYVSQESIEAGRKKRDLWYEYQDLKKQGVLTTIDEYKEWKKKSMANMKKFQESLKGEGEKNEEERAT